MSSDTAISDFDERARRTRNALAKALVELGRQQPVDAITVRDLTRHAGIGRSTFYTHFTSLGDFLRSSYAGMLARGALLGEHEPEGRDKVLATRLILNHVYASREYGSAVRKAREWPGMQTVGEARLRVIAETNLRRLRPDLSETRRRAAATFIAGGFMGMMRQWTETGLRETPDQLRAAFEDLAQTLIVRAASEAP